MTYKTPLSLFFLLSLFTLSACVDQNTADAKMVKGCIGAVNTLQDNKVTSVTKQSITTKNFDGEGNHRHLTLTVEEKDGWLDLENTYSCVFLEEWGMLKSTHRALLVQVNVNGDIYGKKDGVIQGDWDDFLKISRATDAAMGQ